MNLLWWIEYLMPIIDNIIMTKIYYSQNKDINEELRNFWKDIIRIKEGHAYDPNVIICFWIFFLLKNAIYRKKARSVNGWIINFIPDFSEDEPALYDELEEDDVPDQIISYPLELTVIDKETIKYKYSLASGFYRMT